MTRFRILLSGLIMLLEVVDEAVQPEHVSLWTRS